MPWLSMLLDAYDETDKSVRNTIAEAYRGRKLACARGCCACCKTHVTIPVYPLELVGLYWYILEKVAEGNRETIIAQLSGFEPGKGCPFLVEGACGIHPMRPMACRFFNVFSVPCKEGEDPYYTRREDVMTPNEKEKSKALSNMLHHHGITGRAERREAMRTGYINRFARNLQSINWPKVAIRLRQKDRTYFEEI